MKRFISAIIAIILSFIFITNCSQTAGTTEPQDTTPPAAPIITGTTPINTLNPTWTWDISSDVAKVYYQLDSTSDEWSVITDMKVKSHSETVTADDTYVLYVKSQDAAGNYSTISSFAITVDRAGVTASITSSESILTNDSPFTVTVSFNEDVTGFTVDDLRLVNATASNFTATSTNIFTIAITPTADGDLSVDIPADKLTDLAGNSNSASNVFTITYDGTPPTVDVTTGVEIGAFTNVSPIKLTVTFNEVVTNFTEDDLTVVNATITKFQQGFNEMNYKIEITPTDQGEVSLEILANAVTDAAGNGNIASNKFSAIFDTIPPVVKEKILTSDIIVIENAGYVLNQLNFIDEAVELYENDITSDYDDANNKIILTDLAGNISEIANVYDGVDATDGLKYAVETISDATTDWNDVYMMDGTYDMTPTATSLMVNKAINLYGDYKKTFIDYTGGIDIINVGDVKGKATIKDLIVGSASNIGTGVTGVGFAIDGNILEVSGLRTLKSGNLLNVKTYNGGVDPKPNSPYVMIPNGTINCTFFLGDDTAGTGWRKSEYNSNNDQQPTLGGNMTID